MNKSCFVHGLIALLTIHIGASATNTVPPQAGGTSVNKQWVEQFLNVAKQKATKGSMVKVAVIDDGFRLTHKAIKDYLWVNEKEIFGNHQDDDMNGYIDDVTGFDISDGDHDVSIPQGKEAAYYHGTYVAGIITSLFEACYGADAHKHLKIIPIKVLSDRARNTYLADGYKGIRYACEMGADIICCAWSGGSPTEEDKAIINKAIQNGTIIVASAGNFASETTEYPSTYPGVISVAAIDSTMKKHHRSNYGMRVNISAPGVSVYGAYPQADNSYIFDDGTSPAAAVVTGVMAILKASAPKATAIELKEALYNSATPIDQHNLSHSGKLGAGMPHVAKALAYLAKPEKRHLYFDPYRPEGKIIYKRGKSKSHWEIHPHGSYKGIMLYPASIHYKGDINLYSGDSLVYNGSIGVLSKGFQISGNRFGISLKTKQAHARTIEFNYFMQTIDSTTLYCSGTQEIIAEEGVLTDNSGQDNYANNCSCKWLVKVPQGKRIEIEFEEIDTQPNIDFIWIFDGEATLQENLIAKFSGKNKPPVITSTTNQILLWFVTDDNTTGKGWKMRFKAL